MMKDYEYQQNRLKKYVLPIAVQRQAIWAVKDLDRLEQKLKELKEDAYTVKEYDFTTFNKGHRNSFCDATGNDACEITTITWKIQGIRRALDPLPEKYREGILRRILEDVPYDRRYHPNTWRKWQQVFIYHVAVNLRIL